jgi:hypothetical protein
MLVFVDESGDSGMKRKRGSSALFVVTAIIFDENESATACDQKISDLRGELNLHPDSEFHFNKCCDDYRSKFLEAVALMDFLHVSFVLNKEKLWGPGFAYKEPFYKYATKLLFENAKPHLTRASVTIDRSGDREFTRELERYLKRKINTESEIIRKVKCEPSHSNNLLQLADMVCGAIARSYRTDKTSPRKFRRLVGHRELSVQVWPRP